MVFRGSQQFVGSGSKGNNRHTTGFFSPSVNLKNEQIEQIQEYTLKYINKDSKRLRVCFELLRNANISASNSYPLKCSLLVLLIESFFLEGIHSNRKNFGIALSKHLQSNKLNVFMHYYNSRSKFFHTGENIYKDDDWWDLFEIARNLICDFIDDEKLFKRKIIIIKDSITVNEK